MNTENFVEIEEKRRKLSSAKGVGTVHYGNLYSDAYQSLSSIYLLCYMCIQVNSQTDRYTGRHIDMRTETLVVR